jgi:hypothetical protein
MCAALVGGGDSVLGMGSPVGSHPHSAFGVVGVGLRGGPSGLPPLPPGAHHIGGPSTQQSIPIMPPNPSSNGGGGGGPPNGNNEPPPDVLLALLSRNRGLEGTLIIKEVFRVRNYKTFTFNETTFFGYSREL